MIMLGYLRFPTKWACSLNQFQLRLEKVKKKPHNPNFKSNMWVVMT